MPHVYYPDLNKRDAYGSVNVNLPDGQSVDAFGRLRVSNLDSVFDAGFQYDLQPLVFEAKTASGGTITHTPDQSAATLNTTNTAGSSSILQSKQYHRYIPGKSQLVIMTFVAGAATSGNVKRIGYFDVNDGIFLEQNSTTDVAFVRRTSTSGSAVDDRVVQANWNLDKMNGAGPSRITLDLSKAQILVIDLQWLGMGRVRVGFDIAGTIVYCHQFLNANVLTLPYMKTANLPVRWEISTAAGTVGDSMKANCVSVASEGGAELGFGYQFAYNRASVTAGSGTQTYAFSLRPKSTFNSIANRMLIRPINFSALVTGAQPVLVEIYYGTAVGGSPSWTDMDTTYSGLQVDTAGTPSGGVRVASFVVAASGAAAGAASQSLFSRYPLTLDIAGSGYNMYTVYVTGIGGASTCYPGVTWQEIR